MMTYIRLHSVSNNESGLYRRYSAAQHVLTTFFDYISTAKSASRKCSRHLVSTLGG